MTKQQLRQYDTANSLRTLLWQTLAGKKFELDCGHHITFGKYLGNDLTLRNGTKEFKVICSLCGY